MQYNVSLRQDGGKYMVTRSYPYSFTKQLENAIDHFINESGHLDVDDGYSLSLSDLDEYEQGSLAALYLETLDRDVSDCIYGNDYSKDSDYTCALLKMLGNPNQENKDNLATVIHKNVLLHVADSLQELIDDRCGWVYQDWLDNKGFDE